MNASGRFITLLLFLFMFQSVWNVAAAFCGHEAQMKSSSAVLLQHFGHHMTMNCHERNQTGLKENNKITGYSAISNLSENLKNDHRDHLPSFAYFIVDEVQQHTQDVVFSNALSSSFIDWINFYQSPDLYLNHPPPVLTPLLVG